MRNFPVPQFTILQSTEGEYNDSQVQKSYLEFIYPTHSTLNLKSILIQQNLEHYYGIQIEMNYRIIIGILEKWLQDVEEDIHYKQLRQEDIWIRVKPNDGEEINFQRIFEFDIEFSVSPIDFSQDQDVLTLDQFKQILKQITQESKAVYTKIDPDNEDILEYIYDNLYQIIDIINRHQQINSYSSKLYKYFVGQSPNNTLIWNTEENDWGRTLKKDIYKNDIVLNFLLEELQENQNKFDRINNQDIRGLIIEFVTLKVLNGQPYLKKIDDLLTYQEFNNNPLIQEYKEDFLKHLIEIKFFDQTRVNEDYIEFIRNKLKFQNRQGGFFEQLEKECVLECLNDPGLQLHQQIEQKKEMLYKQRIRNHINSFNYRIQETQINVFPVDYEQSYHYWISIVEENIKKLNSLDEALLVTQNQISEIFNKNVEYLDSNYIIGFDYNDLFIISLDQFKILVNQLESEFKNNTYNFKEQKIVQLHIQKQHRLIENYIRQNSPAIPISPLSSIQTSDSQSQSNNTSQSNSVNQSNLSSAQILPPQSQFNNSQSAQNLMPPYYNSQYYQKGDPIHHSQYDDTIYISNDQEQFNRPPQNQQKVGNPMDQSIIPPKDQNMSKMTISVQKSGCDDVDISDVVSKPSRSHVIESLEQTIKCSKELMLKLKEFAHKIQMTQYQAQTFIPNLEKIMNFPRTYVTQIFKETQDHHKIQQNQIPFDQFSHQWDQIISKEEFLQALLKQQEEAFQYATLQFISGIKKNIDSKFTELARQSQ